MPLTAPVTSYAATASSPPSARYVLTDRALIQEQGLNPLLVHGDTGTVLVRLSERQRETLARTAHEHKRCGGHELIAELSPSASLAEARQYANTVFRTLEAQGLRDAKIRARSSIGVPTAPGAKDPLIEKALLEVSETNLRETVGFLSAYPSRNHKSSDGQRAVLAFKTRIEETLKGATLPFTIELIQHQSTPMNSIRLTFKGSSKPEETVVAGAHIDSINASFFGSKIAPGADDNASGSANILEAARILSRGPALARTVEFYWYAGEEGGLLGSAEIAKAAKTAGKKIVGVLQLDMTLFPGDGEFNLGSMTDFTSQDMRDLLATINRDYIFATIMEDKCGYGCSDHASWYKNGYPTLMPFEATMRKMNGNIHSERDAVSSSSSFRHSAMFSKIAIAFLMTLGR